MKLSEILEEVLIDIEDADSLDEAVEIIHTRIEDLKVLEYADEAMEEDDENLNEYEQQGLRTFDTEEDDTDENN